MNRFRRYFFMMKLFIMNTYKRAKYLKKRNFFNSCGDDCYFQIVNFNIEPKMIYLGNNVYIASGVKFWTHDVINMMTNNIYKKKMILTILER